MFSIHYLAKGLVRLLLLFFLLFSFSISKAQTILFDDFNRINSSTLGIPSSGGSVAWMESETAGSDATKILINGNKINLSGCTFSGTGGINGAEQIQYDMSGKYSTIFNFASGDLVWYFNMKQSNANPSGFGSNTYGVAFILGCDESDFSSPTADGYAVIIGNAGTPDPIKLVSFTNGLTANSNTTSFINSTSTTPNTSYSIKVTFNPCTGEWVLSYHADGATFANPTSVALTSSSATANTTFTGYDLKYSGAFWQHGTSCAQSSSFDNFHIPTAMPAFPQYVWNGSVSNDFQVAGNWTPSRSCSQQSDVLIFNSSSPASSNVFNIPTQNIAQLIIQNNRSVKLRSQTLATRTLSLLGTTGEDLQIQAGSSLTIDSNDPLEISLKAGVTADISGNITFINIVGLGLPKDHRLQATDANAVVFKNGSIFTASDLSGSAFGDNSTPATNTTIFNSGSTYVSEDGENPFGMSQPQSKVVFQSGSLYVHKQGVGLSLAGRIYADVEINTISSIGNNFGNSGTLCTIDNFTMKLGSLSFSLASNNQPLNILIKKNLDIQSGASLDFSPLSGLAVSSFTFGGNSTQAISSTGALTFGLNSAIIFSNTNPGSNDINLLNTITTFGTAQFSNGVVNTGSNALFVSNPLTNAVTGGSLNSHVNGHLQRLISAIGFYSFPVGDGAKYERMDINIDGICLGVFFDVKFNNSDPNTTPFISFIENSASFTQVLPEGYWEITPILLCVIPTYELRLFPTGFTNFPVGKASYTIAKRVGAGNWIKNGTLSNPESSLTGIQSDGSVRRANFAGFSNFAIAASPIITLPLTIISFTGKREGNNIKLKWETTSEKNNSGFEIEKSADGMYFEKIGFAKPSEQDSENKLYNFIDLNSLNGNYYRLKQIDVNGKYQYSKILFISDVDRNKMEIFPNPVDEKVQISFVSDGPVSLEIISNYGISVFKTSGTPEQINSVLNKSIIAFSSGLYMISASQNNEKYHAKMVKK